MPRIDYKGQIFGNREVIENECLDEDFIKIGKKIPAQSTRSSYRLTKCLNCGQILPASVKTLKRYPPKKCCFCSGIGYKGSLELNRNAYIELEDCYEISISFKDTTVQCYIDKEDLYLVKQYSWRVSQKRSKYYAVTGQASNKTLLYLHNLLMNKTDHNDGMEVDHIDGNSLNNRKNNLRITSRLKNIQNVSARIDNEIGIRGICKTRNKYKADFSFNNQRYYFKDWDTIEEAVYCRLSAERICGLDIANKNPLVDQYLTLPKEKEDEIYQYTLNKILGN